MKRVFVAGHRGMVGSAILRRIGPEYEVITRSRDELDLLDQRAVRHFFAEEQPNIVILAAAKVGGIKANSENNAEFLYENLTIQNNVIHEAARHGVEYFCFLGSSCIYPKEASQPIKEESLLTGPLEPTNQGYALAKIAGLKLIEFYKKQGIMNGISVMPCNLYGTNDCFDLERSHVLSALVKRFSEGEPVLWGTGEPKREFMHVDDAADAILFLIEKRPDYAWINAGWGKDIPIRELAELIAEKMDYTGTIKWDPTMPNGTMRKCMDVSRMESLGFSPKISLEEGIERTITEYSTLVG